MQFYKLCAPSNLLSNCSVTMILLLKYIIYLILRLSNLRRTNDGRTHCMQNSMFYRELRLLKTMVLSIFRFEFSMPLRSILTGNYYPHVNTWSYNFNRFNRPSFTLAEKSNIEEKWKSSPLIATYLTLF